MLLIDLREPDTPQELIDLTQHETMEPMDPDPMPAAEDGGQVSVLMVTVNAEFMGIDQPIILDFRHHKFEDKSPDSPPKSQILEKERTDPRMRRPEWVPHGSLLITQ